MLLHHTAAWAATYHAGHVMLARVADNHVGDALGTVRRGTAVPVLCDQVLVVGVGVTARSTQTRSNQSRTVSHLADSLPPWVIVGTYLPGGTRLLADAMNPSFGLNVRGRLSNGT